MRTQRAADIAGGLFLAVLGLVVVVAASQIKGAPDARVQPGTFPQILGWAIGIAGVVMALRAWRYRGPATLVAWPDRAGMTRVAVTLAAQAVFLLLMDPLGLPLGTALLVAFLAWYLGRYRLMSAGALGVVTGATVYVVFIHFLQLSCPAGFLGR